MGKADMSARGGTLNAIHAEERVIGQCPNVLDSGTLGPRDGAGEITDHHAGAAFGVGGAWALAPVEDRDEVMEANLHRRGSNRLHTGNCFSHLCEEKFRGACEEDSANHGCVGEDGGSTVVATRVTVREPCSEGSEVRLQVWVGWGDFSDEAMCRGEAAPQLPGRLEGGRRGVALGRLGELDYLGFEWSWVACRDGVCRQEGSDPRVFCRVRRCRCVGRDGRRLAQALAWRRRA